MTKKRFEITIHRSPETIYQTLTDLAGYKSWLPASQLFTATTNISDPITRKGTTYTDTGPATQMQGEVTELEPYTHIRFHQKTLINRSLLRGKLDIRIHYTLKATEQGTKVMRDITIKTGGTLIALQPILLRSIIKENKRILATLKRYLEMRA